MEKLLEKSSSGTLTVQLAIAKGSNFPKIPMLAEKCEPRFKGDPAAFLAQHGDDPIVKKMISNKVKKCSSCGKPCATTLVSCNACGLSLSDVPVSFTNNVFVGFIFGIQKGPFPFTISMRHQDENFMAFDDPLALSACHLNVIPTHAHIPDWRHLLRNPVEGKKLLQKMSDIGWKVTSEQFLSDEKWKSKIIKNGANIPNADLRKHVAIGFNFPPSQWHLHIQYIFMPMVPFHYNQYLQRNHFHLGRFFPLEFIMQILDLDWSNFVFDEEAPVSTLIELCKAKGVDYYEIHQQCYERYNTSHQALSNWKHEDFDGVVVGSEVIRLRGTGSGTPELSKVQAEDKSALANYGRPYVDGNPAGVYYKYAKTLEEFRPLA